MVQYNTAQSRSAWTEQEDAMLRHAVAKYGDRAWATVANDVPGRSSKSCSDRWRNFLSPDIEHPRKSPFTEWEIAVVVQAQHRYGNNWKAISMLLPGRTNRAVKNLFVGNLKWGARLPEIKNLWLENHMTLEQLLEIKPDHAGGPVRLKPGMHYPDGSGSPSSMNAASTSSGGSAWASDMTDQPLSGSPASQSTHRKRGDAGDMAAGQSPPISKRRRGAPSPVVHSQYAMAYSPTAVHPGALGPSVAGSPSLANGMGMFTDMTGLMGPPAAYGANQTFFMNSGAAMYTPVKQRTSTNGTEPNLLSNMHVKDEGSPAVAAYAGQQITGPGIPGLPALMTGQQLQLQSGQQMMGQLGTWQQAVAVSGSNSPFAAMAGQALCDVVSRGASMQNLAAQHGAAGYVDIPGSSAPQSEPLQMQTEGADCTGNPAAYMQTQAWDSSSVAQFNHQQQLQQFQQQQVQQHMFLQQQQLDLQQQTHMQNQGAQAMQNSGKVNVMLAAPGSPHGGLPTVDSMGLQNIFDLDDDDAVDDLLADPTMRQLTQQDLQHTDAPRHSSDVMVAGQAAMQHMPPGAHLHASLDTVTAVNDSCSPQHLARSNTWPNAVPDAAANVPAASGPASFSGYASGHPSGLPLPSKCFNAAGPDLKQGLLMQAGLPQGGAESHQGVQDWGWPGAPHAQTGLQRPAGQHPVHGYGAPSAGGMPSQPPSDPQYMHVMCHQLQQENIMLMQRVATLQNRLASSHELPSASDLGVSIPGGSASPLPTPSSVAPPPVSMCTDPMQLPVNSMSPVSVYPADNSLPRLPPVVTRVGTFPPGTPGAWGSGSQHDRNSAGLTGLESTLGSESLGLGSGVLKDDELQVSPGGTYTPQLLDAVMGDSLFHDEL